VSAAIRSFLWAMVEGRGLAVGSLARQIPDPCARRRRRIKLRLAESRKHLFGYIGDGIIKSAHAKQNHMLSELRQHILTRTHAHAHTDTRTHTHTHTHTDCLSALKFS